MNSVRIFVLQCEAVKNFMKTTQLNRITNRTMMNRRLRIRLVHRATKHMLCDFHRETHVSTDELISGTAGKS